MLVTRQEQANTGNAGGEEEVGVQSAREGPDLEAGPDIAKSFSDVFTDRSGDRPH